MKKRLAFLLFTIFMVSIGSLFAQDNDAFKKGFTLKTAYIMPVGSFGNFTQLPQQYALKDARWGLGLQLGTMFFLNDIKIGDDIRIGIDVTWMAFNGQSSIFQYRDTVNGDPKQGEFNVYHFYIYPEFGPMFSYSPTDNMAIDFSFKATPSLSFVTGTYKPDVNNSEHITGLGYALRFTPAFYFRYDVLLIGYELNIGNAQVSYEGSDHKGTLRQDTPYSTSRLIVGFKF